MFVLQSWVIFEYNKILRIEENYGFQFNACIFAAVSASEFMNQSCLLQHLYINCKSEVQLLSLKFTHLFILLWF